MEVPKQRLRSRRTRYDWLNEELNPYTLMAPAAGTALAELTSRRHARSVSHRFLMAPPHPNAPSHMPALPAGAHAAIAAATAPDLVVERMKGELATALAADVAAFAEQLRLEDRGLEGELAAAMLENQTQIALLGGDLVRALAELGPLRSAMDDLQAVYRAMCEQAERRVDTGALSRPRDRSLVDVVEKMWASGLDLLFRHVDGASKMIQPAPDRRVVAELGRWLELSTTLYRRFQTVHMFVLLDHVLVAAKRGGTKLSAQACYPVGEVQVSETEVPGVSAGLYTIQMVVRGERHLYLTDRFDHFTRVMQALQDAKNAAEQARIAVEGSRLRQSMSLVSSASPRKRELAMLEISSRVHSRSASLEIRSDLGDAKMRMEQLDVETAHRRYGDAVSSVMFCRSVLVRYAEPSGEEEVDVVADVEQHNLAKREAVLVEAMAKELAGAFDGTTPDDVVEGVCRWLASVGRGEVAHQRLLEAASNRIAELLAKIPFTGDVEAHAAHALVVVFSSLALVVLRFRRVFPREVWVHLVTWVHGEVKEFVKRLDRALYGVDELSEVYIGCHAVVRERAGVLRKEGIDVGYLVGGR